MQITCSTTSAAAEVMRIMLHAGLRLLRGYQISPVLSTVRSIIFSMIHALTAAQLV